MHKCCLPFAYSNVPVDIGIYEAFRNQKNFSKILKIRNVGQIKWKKLIALEENHWHPVTGTSFFPFGNFLAKHGNRKNKDFEILIGLEEKKEFACVKKEEKDGLFVDKTVDIPFLTSGYPFLYASTPRSNHQVSSKRA